MANDKLYSETDIEDIANSIRGKNGTTTKYKVSQMAAAIDSLPTGGGAVESVDGQTGVVVTNAVKTIPQTLTDTQKTQVLNNIGANDKYLDKADNNVFVVSVTPPPAAGGELSSNKTFEEIRKAYVDDNKAVVVRFTGNNGLYLLSTYDTQSFVFYSDRLVETSNYISYSTITISSSNKVTFAGGMYSTGKSTVTEYSTEVLTTDWTYYSGAPYPWTATKTITGLPATYSQTPIVEPDATTSFLTDQEMIIKEFNKIFNANASENSLRLYAYEKPNMTLTVKVRVIS